MLTEVACFALFDRSAYAWQKARQWSASPREFVKRGGFVLMACLALHDKNAPDKLFLGFLPLIEKQAPRDEVDTSVYEEVIRPISDIIETHSLSVLPQEVQGMLYFLTYLLKCFFVIIPL